ncbi:MAG: hypothetical protein OM95_16110 [Bdellovibrio sp. ArHS]|uniref:type II secretion system protein n=1 Tax=Bdellovibrio sp. ArHS TaxID=1569284 RepID=UPI000583576E|nr:prepilin-type N-terminal cleavage/methylation domain-containing protein [Bdellovibrio sp. ArHS]KHD87149.1 MAG: hypothetical protein OM95_16110 [Bdellovibrio sp. ArHS]
MNLNNRGVGLVEVLVGLGIMGIITMALLSITDIFSKFQNNYSAVNESNIQSELVRMSLSSASTCNINFVGQTFNPKDLTTASIAPKIPDRIINSDSSEVIIRSGVTTNSLNLKSIKVMEIKSLGTNLYLGKLVLPFSKANALNSLGASELVRRVPIMMKVEENSSVATIKSCAATTITNSADYDLMAQQLCESLEGTWNSSSGKCALKILGQCESGQAMAGVNADGTKICVAASSSSGSGCSAPGAFRACTTYAYSQIGQYTWIDTKGCSWVGTCGVGGSGPTGASCCQSGH